MPGEACERCGWRKELPAEAVSRNDVSIWSVVKQAVGKDLTRITIPIAYCEPISFLQRFAEYLEYAELLKKADSCTDNLARLEYVTAFAISTFASSHKRMAKPFNPLWFETFELDRSKQEGYRFVAEQVSHHPPASAFHTQADVYEFYGTVSPRIKFWGISIEVQTGGVFTLKLLRHNETYTWKSLNCTIHNIIIGELYLTLDGHLHVQCSSGMEANVKIGKGAYSRMFEGCLSQSDKAMKGVYGDWTSFLAVCSAQGFEKKYKDWQEQNKGSMDDDSAIINDDGSLMEGSKLLWKARPRPPKSTKMYHFTSFALLLNDPDFITDSLPRTDARLRPDIRLLEQKRIEEAADEKNRLEVKQREARARQAQMNIEKHPKWFEKQKTKDGKAWVFNGKYWDRNFEDCEDIY